MSRSRLGRYDVPCERARAALGARLVFGGESWDESQERRGERGQATVEFAIVLPLVLLLIVGIVEFGTAFNYWISLNHISNEGSRWTSVDRLPAYTDEGTPVAAKSNPNVDDLEDYIKSQILTQDLRDKVETGGGSIDLCSSGGATPQVGDSATVTIKAPFSFPVVSGMMDLAGRLLAAAPAGLVTSPHGLVDGALRTDADGPAGWRRAPEPRPVATSAAACLPSSRSASRR